MEVIIKFLGWTIFFLPTIIIDSICGKCNAYAWLVHWFGLEPPGLTFDHSEPSASVPGSFDYYFTCNCKKGSGVAIIVTATNDDEAKSLAEAECQRKCP